jgi:hypothetical protein
MTYDAWKTTPPADDEPDVEACGHRVGTCEGECRLDTEPAPALEEESSDDANVSALLDLADWVGRKAFSPGDRYEGVAAALRSYAELVRRLELVRREVALLSMNGCDCECDHHVDEHDGECTRCLACLVQLSLNGEARLVQLSLNGEALATHCWPGLEDG